MSKQTALDQVSADLSYYGEADLGRATNSPFWQLRKTEKVGVVTTVKYPTGPIGDPSDKSIFEWDRRTEYTYSFTPDAVAPTL